VSAAERFLRLRNEMLDAAEAVIDDSPGHTARSPSWQLARKYVIAAAAAQDALMKARIACDCGRELPAGGETSAPWCGMCEGGGEDEDEDEYATGGGVLGPA